MKRGIVTLPVEMKTTEDGAGISLGNALTVLDLNYFALYWDELIIPASQIVYLGITDEEPFIKAGFLKRPEIPVAGGIFNGSDIVSIYSKAQTSFLDAKRRDEKDCDWRLNVMGDTFHLSEQDSILKHSFRIELTKILPVPDSSINIQDILDFKLKRRPELEAFNSYLDELYFEVAASADFNLARAKAFAKLKQSISDLERLNSEGWRSPIKFDTSSLFEASNREWASGMAVLYSIWQANQGNLSAAISAGVVAALGEGFARLKPGLQSMRRKPNDNISYLSKAHKEGVLKKTGG